MSLFWHYTIPVSNQRTGLTVVTWWGCYMKCHPEQLSVPKRKSVHSCHWKSQVITKLIRRTVVPVAAGNTARSFSHIGKNPELRMSFVFPKWPSHFCSLVKWFRPHGQQNTHCMTWYVPDTWLALCDGSGLTSKAAVSAPLSLKQKWTFVYLYHNWRSVFISSHMIKLKRCALWISISNLGETFWDSSNKHVLQICVKATETWLQRGATQTLPWIVVTSASSCQKKGSFQEE